MFYWQVSPAGVHLLLGNESFNGYSCPTASRLPAGENSYNKVFAKYWPTCAALFVVQLNLPTILIHCRNTEAVVLQGVWRSFNVCVCVCLSSFFLHIFQYGVRWTWQVDYKKVSGIKNYLQHLKKYNRDLTQDMRDASGNLQLIQLLFTEMISGEEWLSRNLIKEWEQGENAEVC